MGQLDWAENTRPQEVLLSDTNKNFQAGKCNFDPKWQATRGIIEKENNS